MKDEMSVEKYKNLPMPLAVRALTKELYSTLFLKVSP
jgi:hypothetical protein